jgi:hypothetical protein
MFSVGTMLKLWFVLLICATQPIGNAMTCYRTYPEKNSSGYFMYEDCAKAIDKWEEWKPILPEGVTILPICEQYESDEPLPLSGPPIIDGTRLPPPVFLDPILPRSTPLIPDGLLTAPNVWEHN